jgi:hypothetical protein
MKRVRFGEAPEVLVQRRQGGQIGFVARSDVMARGFDEVASSKFVRHEGPQATEYLLGKISALFERVQIRYCLKELSAFCSRKNSLCLDRRIGRHLSFGNDNRPGQSVVHLIYGAAEA